MTGKVARRVPGRPFSSNENPHPSHGGKTPLRRAFRQFGRRQKRDCCPPILMTCSSSTWKPCLSALPAAPHKICIPGRHNGRNCDISEVLSKFRPHHPPSARLEVDEHPRGCEGRINPPKNQQRLIPREFAEDGFRSSDMNQPLISPAAAAATAIKVCFWARKCVCGPGVGITARQANSGGGGVVMVATGGEQRPGVQVNLEGEGRWSPGLSSAIASLFHQTSPCLRVVVRSETSSRRGVLPIGGAPVSLNGGSSETAARN